MKVTRCLACRKVLMPDGKWRHPVSEARYGKFQSVNGMLVNRGPDIEWTYCTQDCKAAWAAEQERVRRLQTQTFGPGPPDEDVFQVLGFREER